ncbi:MAG: hypothetical protein GYA21_06620 [Myxococcales bacterium]|nr:hypothetical protein [Myxococcales bacterium]
MRRGIAIGAGSLVAIAGLLSLALLRPSRVSMSPAQTESNGDLTESPQTEDPEKPARHFKENRPDVP